VDDAGERRFSDYPVERERAVPTADKTYTPITPERLTVMLFVDI
jgi:hypothetical protein